MNGSTASRVDVFNELTRPKGTFDYEKCCKLLGDNYDSFVNFCDAVKVIPEEIESLEVVNFNDKRNTAFYSITMMDGKRLDLEK